MKAIAINGSPRAGGNTEIMLRKVLEPLEAAVPADSPFPRVALELR